MLSKKHLNPIVTELFVRRRELNFSFIFITQSYVGGQKNIRLNSTQSFNKTHLIIDQILALKTL